MSKKVLHVVTNIDRYEDGTPTGLWLSELVHVYDQLEAAGVEQVIASPAGGRSPIEPRSLLPVITDAETMARAEDPAFMALLDATVPLAEVDAAEFDAIYLAGGHGTLYDFPSSPELARILGELDARGAVIASVCHGPAGFLEASRSDGRPLVADRRMTGFSWIEEMAAGVAKRVPYSLEERLRELGGRYERTPLPLAPKAVADGTFITGQNPTSARRVGELLLQALHVSAPEPDEGAVLRVGPRPERALVLGAIGIGAVAVLGALARRGRGSRPS